MVTGKLMDKNKRALIIGCGDLGLRCAKLLIDEGVVVTGARRNSSALPDWVNPIAIDVTRPESLEPVREQSWDLVIISLTARDEEGYGQVYVQGLKNILAALKDSPLVLFASSTSVYAQTDGSWINEESVTEPDVFAGRRILEAELLIQESEFDSASVRLSGLYGGGRSNHLLAALREGRICPTLPVKYSNRIYVDDAASLIVHLAKKYFSGDDLQEVYLAADGNPAPLREIMEWLATENDMDIDVLEENYYARRGGNRRCSNSRVQDSGFGFKYDHYSKGFKA